MFYTDFMDSDDTVHFSNLGFTDLHTQQQGVCHLKNCLFTNFKIGGFRQAEPAH